LNLFDFEFKMDVEDMITESEPKELPSPKLSRSNISIEKSPSQNNLKIQPNENSSSSIVRAHSSSSICHTVPKSGHLIDLVYYLVTSNNSGSFFFFFLSFSFLKKK